MLLSIGSWLGKWGTTLGLVCIVLPFVYDVIGVLYGRDLHIKIELVGCIIQLTGVFAILVTIAIRKWAGDRRIL